ncbi:hypothetical protein [Variovorax sp. PAMC28562]|uniref:hypothetical protein n=1 Tax=Variovorax sp. PAMC28562 TaxID=2762323 RepID=UPI001C9B882E|nr:hypothetical protein [Variovorax sp. PAMC28562]
MRDDSLSMGVAFSHWQQLTDEYAQSLQALARGDRHCVENLDRIARTLLQSQVARAPKSALPPPDKPSTRWRCWCNAFASLYRLPRAAVRH